MFTRRDFLKVAGICAGTALMCDAAEMSAVTSASPHKKIKWNVLFIPVDDLRCNLGCYGDPLAHTPNIDKLAASGTVFSHAYCQQAICNPSRASLLTGRKPDTTKVLGLNEHFRDTMPDIVTLPQFFKNNGYHTQSIGKIFHGEGRPALDPPSWSVEPQYDTKSPGKYLLKENIEVKGKAASVECADVADGDYTDGIVCDAAIEALKNIKQTGKNFFLGVGFRKPHLPFCAPKKYWDMYDREKLAVPATTQLPQGAPQFAGHDWPELRGYNDIPDEGPLTPEKTAELRHGYYAATSYTDALVGRLLAALDELGFSDNTIVVLWGDHGWHIGEHGIWGKLTNYEICTRSPLIIKQTWQKQPGKPSKAVVQFLDVYPTIVDMCGFKVPRDLEGVSLKQLLVNPNAKWTNLAFSQFHRPPLYNFNKSKPELMGYSVRNTRYRYTQWRKYGTTEVVAAELYDYEKDPNETVNVANDPKLAKVVKELTKAIKGYAG